MFLQTVMMIFVMGLIPVLMGMLITRKFSKYKNSFAFAAVIGFIIEFALVELLYLILVVVLHIKALNVIVYVYGAIICLLSILSIFINYDNIGNAFFEIVDSFKKKDKKEIMLLVLAIVLICVQLYFCVFQKMILIDYDYFADINTIVEEGKIASFDEYGNPNPDIKINDISGYKVFIAMNSNLINVHPLIIGLDVIPTILIILTYEVYYCLICNVFKNKYKRLVALLFVNIVTMFGYSSTFLPFYMYNLWIGNSVLATFIIPFILLVYMDYVDDGDGDNLYMVVLFLGVMASLLFSYASIVLVGIELVSLLIVYLIRDNEWKDILKVLICLIPLIIAMFIHWKIK